MLPALRPRIGPAVHGDALTLQHGAHHVPARGHVLGRGERGRQRMVLTPGEHPVPLIRPQMMSINYGGVYLAAVSCARQMIKYNIPGSLLLIGSMSGLIANKGFTASVYNSSKAAVIQLTRRLAMEWGQICDGKAIRVSALCPGNILTPVRMNLLCSLCLLI